MKLRDSVAAEPSDATDVRPTPVGPKTQNPAVRYFHRPWCTAYDVVNSRRVHLRRTLGPIYFTDFRSKFRLRLIRVFEVVASIRIRLDDLLIDAE